jgi:hypothetical protein
LKYAYKGTDTIPLVRIPKWDFHWQGQYVFKNLVKVPATYFLQSKHVFDNTTNNPNTPNHNVPVSAGTDTDDEMHFDSFLYTLYQTGDENIDIESMLLNDTLFFPTGIETITAVKNLAVYPNPTEDQLNIQFNLQSSQRVLLTITDMLGRRIASLPQGTLAAGPKEKQVSLSTYHLQSGTYMLSVQAGQDRQSTLFSVR